MMEEPTAAELAAHPLLAGLPGEMLDEIAACAAWAEFAPGAALLREGEAADVVHLLQSGRAALSVASPGRAPTVFQTVGGGEVVGVSWLAPPARWRWDATATEPVTAIALDAARLRALCDADPALGHALMKRMVPVLLSRLHAARMQALDLYGDAD
ncbi:cyclic nucleotide-binding domain-containing protein [Albimonas sp. CAU 1670]|uniref:cyclic nucleotide-binding domain-containing protein n=1 Tax=Albimonas sp. CAU 1670 TaxID=3032599 RepID=UPI0023DC21E5|nr:cyclic nucleotide-binding domain-containing protein [Albimonas sp. CAU 1670]MDF2231826.1 cyclic nucleotide-binding domain-containing protein [Albimonas sp. CAU 1670]